MLFLSFFGYAQTTKDTVYLTSNWESTTLQKAMQIFGVREIDTNGCGLVTYYTKDGTLKSRQNQFNDHKNGLSTWFYEEGFLYTENQYVMDTLNGLQKRFNKSGELIFLAEYDMGKYLQHVSFHPITGLAISKESEIIDGPETEPTFRGGLRGLQFWISQNVQYPKSAVKGRVQGKVFIEFVVNRDGSLSDIEIHESPFISLSGEAMRLVKSMPKWTPGKMGDEFVRTKVRLPINFTIYDDRK
jgi:TonB family protein